MAARKPPTDSTTPPTPETPDPAAPPVEAAALESATPSGFSAFAAVETSEDLPNPDRVAGDDPWWPFRQHPPQNRVAVGLLTSSRQVETLILVPAPGRDRKIRVQGTFWEHVASTVTDRFQYEQRS